MHITNKSDGIHILNHGVLSVSEMADGTVGLDPLKLGQALAKINRYAGNTAVPWNDAEHSMLVAHLTSRVVELVDVEELFLKRPTVVDSVKLWQFLCNTDENVTYRLACMARYWGLLHDVVEVVVGDTPNPVKKYEESHRDGAGGPTCEDQIVAQLKVQQLGWPARKLAEEFTGLSHQNCPANDATAMLILELLQDFVKPADKLALLVEMRNMHDKEVLDYVYRSWDVNPATKHFVDAFKWGRIDFQSGFEGIDWRNSARCWTAAVESSKREIALLF